MMKTQCPGCKAKFNVSDQNVGKKAKCPKCAQPFTIEPVIETPAQAPVKKVESPAPPPTPASAPPQAAAPAKAPEKPASKKLSKTLFVYCWMAAQIIAGVLGLVAVVLALRKSPNTTLLATFAAGDIFLVCSLAIELALFYKMWAAIQTGDASTTPAKAVGFMFIPVFNIYWALSMITGFAEDYNDFIRRNSIKTKALSLILALVFAFMFILSATIVTTPFVCVLAFVRFVSRAFISYRSISWILFSLAFVAGIGHFITYVLFATKICDAVNALKD
jgi:predicted Zn finger-like uncharacterized protein